MEQSYDSSGRLAEESKVFTNRLGGRRAMDRVLAGENQAIPFSIRVIFYLVVTTTVMYALVLLVKYGDAASLYAENGLLEWLQISLLLICASLLYQSGNYLAEMNESWQFLPQAYYWQVLSQS